MKKNLILTNTHGVKATFQLLENKAVTGPSQHRP